MSAILDLCALRLAIFDRCDALGLADRAKLLRTKSVTDYPEESRRQFCELNLAARDLHAAVTKAHEAAPGMVVVDSVLGRLAELALALEKDASRGIVLCDRVIADRFEAREAAKDRPVLATTRHMNLSRGDDR